MRVLPLHSWQMSVSQAMAIQTKLARQVLPINEYVAPSLIAGVDMSVERAKGMASGAVVILSYPELKLVETSVVAGQLDFPYVPGLLSFREARQA